MDDFNHTFRDDKRRFIQYLMTKHSVPGVSAVFLNDIGPAETISTGVASLKTKEPVDENTNFQLASLSKLIFARLCYELKEHNKLDLFADMSENISRLGVEILSCNVTAADIIKHTSGFNTRGFRGVDLCHSPMPKKAYLKFLNSTSPILIDPAAKGKYSYSGGGYFLLEMVLEGLLGNTIESVLSHDEFPIKSIISDDIPSTKHVADSHYMMGDEEGERVQRFDYRTYPAKSAAGLWGNAITLESMLRSTIELFNKDQVPFQTEDNSPHCLLAYRAKAAAGITIFSHSGENKGYISAIYVAPQRRKGFAILTNSCTGALLISDLVKAVSLAKFFSA